MRSFYKLLLLGMTTLMNAVIAHADPMPSDQNVYDFSFESIDGGALPLSAYRGKVILIVNTASKCGFTPQYKRLEALYTGYKERGLVVIGVPSNDFGEQEPGTSTDIKTFCALHYGVTFPITSKQIVSGDQAHPFYRWAHNVLGFGSGPKWNFHKYLIDKKGHVIDYFSALTAPESEKLVLAIEKQLSEN